MMTEPLFPVHLTDDAPGYDLREVASDEFVSRLYAADAEGLAVGQPVLIQTQRTVPPEATAAELTQLAAIALACQFPVAIVLTETHVQLDLGNGSLRRIPRQTFLTLHPATLAVVGAY